MADIFSKKKRSKIMRAVKNKDSGIEIDFRKKIWKEGFRYRKNWLKYYGKPDLVFKNRKVVIFIDSCFWHGCDRHGSIPSIHKNFWIKKLVRNKERDREVNIYYKKIGWRVLRFWEHDLKKNPGKCFEIAIDALIFK